MKQSASPASSGLIAAFCSILSKSARVCPIKSSRRSGSTSPIQAIASALATGLLLASCGSDEGLGLDLGDDGNLDTSGLFTYEEAQPVVTITGPAFTNANVSSDSLQYKILIDAAVENELSASDPNSISVTNATIEALSKLDEDNLDEYILYLQPDPLVSAEDINITVLAGAVSARIGEGNFPNEAASFIVEYDNVAPSVDITIDNSFGSVFLEEAGAADVSSDDYYVVNSDFSVLFRFDEEVTALAASDIEFSVAGVNVSNTVALSGGLTYRADITLDDSNTLADNTDILLVLSAGAVEDLSGDKTEQELDEANISGYAEIDGYANARAEYLVTLDRSPPTGVVGSVPSAVDYSRVADFDLGGVALTESIVPLQAGDDLEFVIEFSEAIVVSGIPYIPIGIDSLLNDANSIELEKKALFVALGANSLGVADAAATFIYTVEAGSNLLDSDGISASVGDSETPQMIFPDGAFIADKYANAIVEDIALTPAYSLAELNVDTIAPEITDITWASTGHVYNSESEDGKFSVNEIITFNLSFSEVIYPDSLDETVGDYSFSINLKSGEAVSPVAVAGTSHVVEGGVSVFQFEYLIEEGDNAIDGIAYVSFTGPAELFADEAGNAISRELGSLLSRTEEEINIFIDADSPELRSITEISLPAASSGTTKDAGARYYVGANYKTADAEIIQLQLSFSEAVSLSKVDLAQDSAVNLIAYFKDNSADSIASDNTYSFAYSGAYDELSTTLLFEYEVVPFGEPGVTSDDLDGIELDYLLLDNVAIRDDYGNSIALDSSDAVNLVYRASVNNGDVDLDFLQNLNIETTPAVITGISFSGVENGGEMLVALGEGSSVEVILTFDQPVEFYYSLSGGDTSKPSLALEIVEGTQPNLSSSNIVYAYHSSPGLGQSADVHTFTYTIQPEDANNTESSIWLLRNSILADNGNYNDLMVVTGSRVYDQRGRDVQEDFSRSSIDDYIFDNGYERHPLILIETGTEPIAYFRRPDGYDAEGINDYIIYPTESSGSISFTLAYGRSELELTHVQVLIEDGADAADLPYLLLYGDLLDDSDADGDGVADNSARWEARAYLSLSDSGLQSAEDNTYNALIFILSEPEDPSDGFAAQYLSSESIGLVYDSLVIGDSYSIATAQGNPIQTDLSAYTYDNDASLTLSTARERIFYDPNPRIVSVVELATTDTVNGDKSYNLDEIIKVVVSVSEDIEVSGSGAIRLYLLGDVIDQDLDGYYSDQLIALDYISSESDERDLVFGYQVEKDKYADLVSLDSDDGRRAIETTGSASIKDLSSAGRELRGFAEGLVLTYAGGVVSSIDSRAPRIDSLSMSRIPSGTLSTQEAIEGNETITFVSGDQLVITLTFYSESVTGSSELSSIFGSPYVEAEGVDGLGRGPRLRLAIDPGAGYASSSTTRYADYDNGAVGSARATPLNNFFTEHLFTYQITSDDHDTSGLSLVGPLDSSVGVFRNIPDAGDPNDKNEANYSLQGALTELGMAANSAVEEYELSYIVIDNYPTLVGFHIDTSDYSASHTTPDLRFTPDRYRRIQFYAIINQADVDEDSVNTTVTLPFSIYDSTTGDIEQFSATYAGWRSSSGNNSLTITDIDQYYPVNSDNYSVFLFTFDFANASKASNVNADTILIPENPFQDQTFNPQNSVGIAVNLSLDATTITSVPISGVDQLIVDFRPPEISAIELPEAGLYYHSSDPSSTMSELTYKLRFSEPVYAANLPQYPGGTPRLYQRIGSGAESFSNCASSPCVDGPADDNSSLLMFSSSDSVVEFNYSIAANDSGYVDSFYVLGGPDTDVADGSINAISDAYGNQLNGYILPEFSSDGRDLSDSDSINLLVDNSELFIEAVNLPAAAIYQAGDEINITVEFSRAVELKQSGVNFPLISFLVGAQESNYSDGNTSAVFQAFYGQQSDILTFVYEVEDGLGRDDYDGIELNPAVIDWNGADLEDALRPTEAINTADAAMTDLSSFIASDVVSGVYIDVVYPQLEISELLLAANQDNAADGFASNDYHYYLNSDLVFNLTFNEPVVVPSVAGAYQSFIKFAYADSAGSEYERSVYFDPDVASSTLAQYGQSWNYNLGASAELYFVYEVGVADATSAADANGFIADGYLRLSDINLSGVVDRSGKPLLLTSQPSITPTTAVIDLDKTSIYSYNLFALDESNQSYDLYSSNAAASASSGLLTDERYITSGQDLVMEFSFRHHPAEDPSQVIFDLGGSTGLFLEVDIDNDQNSNFYATLQEDSNPSKSYSDGTSTLRYLLDLSSYTDTYALSDLDGIGIAFHDDDITNGIYRDQSGPVNLAFADIFLSSLELINVDTQGPEIESVYMQPSASGLTLYYGANDELQITVQFSEPIDVASGTFNDIDLSFSLYDVDQGIAGDRVASYLSNDANRSYVFAYIVNGNTDTDFEQIYFDSVVLSHATGTDITSIVGDTRADPNPLENATFTYADTSAVVQYHAIDFADPSIASLIVPPGAASSKTLSLGGGDELALTLVTSREVAFADDASPRLRLFADSTPITFHYAGDYNASIFAVSHTFTYSVGANIETGSTGLRIPADALQSDNAGGFDAGNNPLNTTLDVSSSTSQFDTGGTIWVNNPTEYIFIDSRVPEFADKYIPPQSLYLEYKDSNVGIEFNSSHVFRLDTVAGSGFPSEFSGGFVAGADAAATAVDFTRPVYQTQLEDGTRWYIWSSTSDNYYRISTSDPYTPWLFSKNRDVASIQDVFIPGTITEFGELSSSNNVWYLVSNLTNGGAVDFDDANYNFAATIDASLNQRYLIEETLHTYLVLSEPVQVAEAYEAQGDYSNYPAYSLTYTNSFDGSNSAAELPLTFSHWIEARPDADTTAYKQVMVYSNTLNASTTNRSGTSVQPSRQLADGADLAIQDLFGNALAIADDNSSLSVYQDADNNNLAGVQLSGYLVQLESVDLYHLSSTSPDQLNAIDPDFTYIIGDQLVLDLSFNAELSEATYDSSQDLFLTLVLNDATSKVHVLGDSSPGAGISGDTDKRYWYNSESSDYDDSSTRANYEVNGIADPSQNYNDVLRYIFTIPDRADGDDFNTLEEGVGEPNLTISGLSFNEGLVDADGAKVDESTVLAALRQRRPAGNHRFDSSANPSRQQRQRWRRLFRARRIHHLLAR